MMVFVFISPVTFFVVAEFGEHMGGSSEWLFHPPYAVILNSVIHGSVLYWVRSKCLKRADELLGRVKEGND